MAKKKDSIGKAASKANTRASKPMGSTTAVAAERAARRAGMNKASVKKTGATVKKATTAQKKASTAGRKRAAAHTKKGK